MKATEVLNRYAKGERDFRGANLRGQNFKEQNLSGADFSEADIKGTNFTNAILKEAKFSKAKAGLKVRAVIRLLIVALLLAVLSGYTSALVGYQTTYSFHPDNIGSSVIPYGLVVISISAIFSYALVSQGLETAIGTLAIVLTIGFFIAPSGALVAALALIGVICGALAVAGAVFAAGSVAGVISVACILIVSEYMTLIISLGIVSASESGSYPILAADAAGFAITLAAATPFLSAYVGWHTALDDERFKLIWRFVIALASISDNTSFRGADLAKADFTQAQLKGADFREARITHVCWYQAENLEQARVKGTILSQSAVRKLVVTGDESRGLLTNLNLKEAYLVGANLAHSNLTNSDVSGAILKNANLEGAILTRLQALGTDFTKSQFTGACLESWNIDCTTKLDNAICEYVYLIRNKGERRPSSGVFASNEFTKLFQEALSTVDLIFRNGVDWKAFVAAFKQVQVQNEDTPLEIQSIENKGDGVIVVRVSVPPDTNKKKIHSEFNQQYELALKALEAKYQAELKAKEGEIAIYREQSANMMEITKLLASRPINVEANAVSNSQSSGDTYNGNIKATNFAPHGTAIGGTFNDYSQTITNNLDEIQQLITTLRSQAEQFPPDARNEVLEHLKDLQEDLKHLDKVKPSRLKATFAALLAIAVGVATATDFSNNVLELGKKFGVELVHPQGTPSSQSPHSQGTQTVDVKRLEGGH